MSDLTSSDDAASRREIVRDVLIFQVKLWLEGFKDIVLMPLSLGAALIDLVFRARKRQGALYSVMKLGDRFEQWVHLYAALEESEKRAPPEPSLDEFLSEAADDLEKKAMEDRSARRDPSQSS